MFDFKIIAPEQLTEGDRVSIKDALKSPGGRLFCGLLQHRYQKSVDSMTRDKISSEERDMHLFDAKGARAGMAIVNDLLMAPAKKETEDAET